MAARLYVGMDLGKSFHQVSVVDERKEVVGAPLRVRRGSAGIKTLLWAASLRSLALHTNLNTQFVSTIIGTEEHPLMF